MPATEISTHKSWEALGGNNMRSATCNPLTFIHSGDTLWRHDLGDLILEVHRSILSVEPE